jgi:hypothetical protein
VSQRAVREADDYVKHILRSLPTTNEIDLQANGSGGVLRVMRESGYNTNKAKLLEGYGDYRMGGTRDNEGKAVRTAVLEGLGIDAFSDCAYTNYGLAAINDDSNEGWPSTAPRTFTVTAVLLAGASGTP